MGATNSEFYASQLDIHSTTIHGLGWGSESSQVLRFSILATIGNLKGMNILDVGCGFGDLYGYLRNRNSNIGGYLGVDLLANMVSEAKNRWPAAEFVTGDFLSLDFDSIGYSADYTFGSGLFCLPDVDWDEYVIATMQKMLNLSTIGIGVNFLSAMCSSPNSDSKYAHPSRVLELVLETVSDRVALNHKYKANDFTVFAYKASAQWPQPK